jgi:hypothetical protein
MTTYSVPRPTCCLDALFNWAIYVEYPYDLTGSDMDGLPLICDEHKR